MVDVHQVETDDRLAQEINARQVQETNVRLVREKSVRAIKVVKYHQLDGVR